MSEVMTCMPFEQLMNWVLEEKETKGTVFGQHRAYVAEADKKLNIFERNLETPIWTCSRSTYTVDTEYRSFLLCRRTFL